ncbi:MAG: CehA/McbA family metallohydrolase [Planctomycetota bacterium]
MSKDLSFKVSVFLLAGLLALSGETFLQAPVNCYADTGESLKMVPDEVPVAGATVDSSFEITLGADGLADGGAIELRCERWRSALAFEFDDFQIVCDNPAAVFDIEVPLKNNWLRKHNPRICQVTLKKGGPLRAGTKVIIKISIKYANQNNVRSTISAHVTPRSGEKARLVEGQFVLRSRHDSAAEIRCIAESRPIADQPGRIMVAVVDKHGNPVEDFRGTVRLRCNTNPNQSKKYSFTAKDSGSRQFQLRYPGGAVSRIEVKCGDMSAVSNPILPRRPDEPGIYFGDIHSHCRISSDGVGSPDHAYEYARKFYGLDLAALSDHSPKGADWQREIETANRYNRDGEFVTFIGFEWSHPAKGHRNIYYRGDNGPPHQRGLSSNMGPLWDYLDQKNIRALTVPHHTNTQSVPLRPNGKPYWGPTDFSAINHKYQRIVEICQIRGSFEVPGGPVPELRVTAKDFGSSVQTALEKGHRFGFIGATDTHFGRPGQGPARCAIISNEFSRRGLWDAMYKRSCYATSGKHILVLFSLNDRPMGSELKLLKAEVKRYIKWRVVGTGPLKRVDLLRNNKVIKSWPGHDRDDISGDFTFDESRNKTEWWYLRAIQEDTEIAWSSPIWVD